MQTIAKILLAMLFIFLLQPAYAETPAGQLDQLLKNISSMKSDFTQIIRDNKNKVLQKSNGNMALKRPGKFRWNTIAPHKQLVITNGIRLWIYDQDLEQVVIKGLAKQTGQTPALLLSDENPTFETDFQVKIQSVAKSDLTWFRLTPKDKSSMFEFIRMAFKGQELKEMQLQDHLGHTTTIQFTHSQFNTAVADAYFYFAPPKNVDVIDETKQ